VSGLADGVVTEPGSANTLPAALFLMLLCESLPILLSRRASPRRFDAIPMKRIDLGENHHD
jgi:hypothetical protein